MTKRAFDKIMEGLDQVRAYLDGTADEHRYRVHMRENVGSREDSQAPWPVAGNSGRKDRTKLRD
jgi:hypothetical protein